MSDNSINPIRSGMIAVSGTLPKTQEKASRAPAPKTEATFSAVAAQVESKAEAAKPAPPAAPAANDMADVSIYFRVNDQTKELAVFVIDRNSKQVLRSIPASEFNSMPAGELLRITA